MLYDDVIRKKQHADMMDAVKEAAGSAAASGGVLGGVSRMLNGERSLAGILKAAGVSALGAGGLAGGATYVGSKLLGEPDDEDPAAYTNRGMLGGAIGGGLLGAGAGALMGSGRLRGLAHLPGVGKLSAMAKDLPLDNVIVDKLKKWASQPGGASSGKSAALLGAILGGAAGFTGGSEGMQLDYVRNNSRDPQQPMQEEDPYERTR